MDLSQYSTKNTMTTVAILKATWFGRDADEEYLFHIICRGQHDFIILEEKNTDKRYRVEYDNHYRKIEDTVLEIVEELRTREFDNHPEELSDTPIAWRFYDRIVHDICELIEHRVENFELQGNAEKYPELISSDKTRAMNSAIISLVPAIESEYRHVRQHLS